MATRRKKKTSPARHAEDEERERPHDGQDGAKMGRRPVWQGYLKLSLVNCPVALFNATSGANDIHFHMINPKTNNRVRMTPTDPDTGPIERADLVKGTRSRRIATSSLPRTNSMPSSWRRRTRSTSSVS